MNHLLARFYPSIRDLRRDEHGQDLIEYALLLTLISLTLISSINGIASAVNLVFNNISTTLA